MREFHQTRADKRIFMYLLSIMHFSHTVSSFQLHGKYWVWEGLSKYSHKLLPKVCWGMFCFVFFFPFACNGHEHTKEQYFNPTCFYIFLMTTWNKMKNTWASISYWKTNHHETGNFYLNPKEQPIVKYKQYYSNMLYSQSCNVIQKIFIRNVPPIYVWATNSH